MVTRRHSDAGSDEANMPASPKPLRVMIVGDSMTHGGEGDYTWRYRLWKWCSDQGLNLAFTGPYKGTQDADKPSPPRPPPLYKTWDPPQPQRTSGGYAADIDQCFDSHHFSTWGRQCVQTKDEIEGVLREHPTDLVLVMLGFNDIGWLVSDAKGTLESMSTLVHNARKANPSLQFAVANIPQRTYMDGRPDLPKSTDEYNALIKDSVAKWSTKQSPIHLVRLKEEYEADTASYDGLHPNALGDYQIAKAFSITLVEDFELGDEPLKVPKHIPARPLHTPRNFCMVSSPGGVTATWDKVYGCQGYEFRYSIDDGDQITDRLGSNRWDTHWASEGQLYQAQVRSLYGESWSDWSSLISATAHPKLAAAPKDFRVKTVSDGAVVSWDTPTGPYTEHIVQYEVLWKDKHVPAMFPSMGGFKASPAHIDELEHGHTYDIWALTWNTAGEGLPGPMQEFTIGS